MTRVYELCSGYSQHVFNVLQSTSSSRWSRKTLGQGYRIALTGPKHPLDAELVSCTQNRFKATRVEQTHCQGPTCSCQIHSNSSIVVYRFQASCFHHRRTNHVSMSSSQLWVRHITLLVLVLASASRILWSICLCIGQDSMSNRVEQHQDTVVILSSNCR